MTKSNEAETNPSTNGLSADALNLLRRFSPNESNRDSRDSSEPISPPISIAAKITKRDELSGRALLKSLDHKGLRAVAAPRRVMSPRISVMRDCDLVESFDPAAIPRDAPARMARTLISVPAPTNSRLDIVQLYRAKICRLFK